MKRLLTTTALLFAAGLAQASELTIVREVDSNNYDPHKSTARAASEILFMLGDTLVSLAPDMQTVEPGIAESWEVSEDGKTYTFKLREDVTFCDGKALTAADVVYSMNRWIDPETKSPVAWRAGEVESVTAVDDYTVEYKLTAPFSELLYQLTQGFGTIIDQANVEALGPDFGISGFNGTGPYCWVEWTPRDKMILEKHEAYTWGAPFHANTGPASIDRITWQIVPEENTRTVAVITGQSQVTQYVPYIALEQLAASPGVEVVRSDLAFWTYFMGFKIDKDTVSDPAVRKAINLAVDQAAMSEDLFFGVVQPAYSYVSQEALDWNSSIDDKLLKFDPAEANRLLDEAGWVRGDDGVRSKDGVRLSPTAYVFAGSTWGKLSEAVQAYLLEIGVDMQIQAFDATVAWGKLATQEFDMFGMSFPYVSSGDALNLYFRSQNMPSPNRMNWDDPETDALLLAGATAISDEDRASAYGDVLEKVHDAAVWLPLYHEPMVIAQSSDLETIVPHNIYGSGLYKGLDLKFKE
ncbi:peptide ABC transporter substrate-binding protein [Pseudooceanicola lipolyticus]|uniref:Peptide ABC transporter substrate-binding protein n=1 Tax=Pseudooceanicola lipolyticus TaxID=2029104 RepID=A0A2M8J7D3_9RHOB|nr:ABC transporter substrate-binding protein [Pseudooceanicola lipolyticus]PJE38690.1 peptide ABC transporter substrate-binding protein [Pseudooceanicola lipolyticus]